VIIAETGRAGSRFFDESSGRCRCLHISSELLAVAGFFHIQFVSDCIEAYGSFIEPRFDRR